MPLTNFGAILNFAEQLEREDLEFYDKAAAASDSATLGGRFATLAKENKKSLALVQRTRRENVTEMILEPIRDFTRAPYQIRPEEMAGWDADAAMALEKRAMRYYLDAAEKIRALPEVARALKTLAKTRSMRLERLKTGEA